MDNSMLAFFEITMAGYPGSGGACLTFQRITAETSRSIYTSPKRRALPRLVQTLSDVMPVMAADSTICYIKFHRQTDFGL